LFFSFSSFLIYKKQNKNNKKKRILIWIHGGCLSFPSWLLSWLLNEVAGCGGARTEPPNFDFAIAVVARG
jgi:hypothetical protein